jgi:molecular chaperone GrpE (heat shock protein)
VTHDESQYENSVETDVEAESSRPSEIIEEQLRAAEEKARTYLANWQRAQADLENLRKRAQQDRREALDIANSTLMAMLRARLTTWSERSPVPQPRCARPRGWMAQS